MDNGQDDYRDAAKEAALGVPAPRRVAVAYAVALLVLMAVATALVICDRIF
ncbi:hypothetical protein [Kitasatospora sp. NPDC088351]|uniref:hypothetical protein n=1 Tax=Kitasatospora sp. NPDC088351 TaxID=3155180 RepID=UPI00344A0A01